MASTGVRPKAITPVKTKPVDDGNGLDLAAYKTRFMSSRDFDPIDTTGSATQIQLESSTSLSQADLRACFDLIELTSFHDYTASSMGWHPRKKLKEMRLPDLRYLLVRPSNAADSEARALLQGFASFMLTYEDGREVIYVYELHLAPELRGNGLGKRLMGMVEQAGRKASMEASMLTVFTSNARALAFYERLGYVVDEYSPKARVFRNGSVKEPDYVILSKPLRAELDASGS